MTVDEARLRATLANPDPRFDAIRELVKRGRPVATPKPRTPRRVMFILDGFVWSRLPIVKVRLIGFRRHFKYFYSMADGMYDLADDVRELVCEPIRGDVYAMWSDPTERWGR